MSLWVFRGLRDGVVTTKWPRKPDAYADECLRAGFEVRPGFRPPAALRRSVHVRHVDAGSDGSVEWEIQALLGPVYDIHRLGIFFTASPRHADVLLVTGSGTPGMEGPLRETYEGMPDPKVVIAAGDDTAAIDHVVPVDIWVGGSPPSPFGILNGLLAAIGRRVAA